MSTATKDDDLLVTMRRSDLKALMVEAVVLAQRMHANEAAEDSAGLTGRGAARLAKKRFSEVLAAMASGALPARKSGAHWKTTAADVRTWIRAGCPVKPRA